MGELINMGNYPFPKFYIKAVGGQYSLVHRLTHSYMESVETEEDLIEAVIGYSELEEQELWEHLIDKNRISIPTSKVSGLDKESHADEMLRTAWYQYTNTFYEENEDLYIEDKVLPIDLLNKIRRERYESSRQASLIREEERREAEATYNESIKSAKKVKVEPESKGKLGSEQSLNRMKKKGKKVLKLKIKKGKNIIEVIDSADPFA